MFYLNKCLVVLAIIFYISPLSADTTVRGVYNVMDFGAKPDGTTDSTLAFQRALDAAYAVGGGIVKVPTGKFLFKGHLNIPRNVALEGVATAPQRFDSDLGTTLLVTEGKDKADGTPFIFMKDCSVVKGLKIFYPEQSMTDPTPYPWTVRGEGDNISIIDVLMLNPWQAVDFGANPCGRHLVRNLYASPIKTGIFIDKCYDVGRLENVHFWPFWDEKIMSYTEKNATAFIFGRTDWEYVTGCFSIRYNVGFKFGDFGSGPGNVVMTNSGSDICPTAVLVENVQGHAGVAFTNCQFMATIDVKNTNEGPVKFVNCGFWGTIDYKTGPHAIIKGNGNVIFSACHFNQWDLENKGDYAIVAEGNGLTVTGCDFMDENKNQIWLKEGAKANIITSNRLRGGKKIKNESKSQAQIGLNITE